MSDLADLQILCNYGLTGTKLDCIQVHLALLIQIGQFKKNIYSLLIRVLMNEEPLTAGKILFNYLQNGDCFAEKLVSC